MAGDTARFKRAALSANNEAALAVPTPPLIPGMESLLGFRGGGGLGSSRLQSPALAERSQRARRASRVDSRKESGEDDDLHNDDDLVLQVGVSIDSSEERRPRLGAAAERLRLTTSVIDVHVRPVEVPDRCADSDRRWRLFDGSAATNEGSCILSVEVRCAFPLDGCRFVDGEAEGRRTSTGLLTALSCLPRKRRPISWCRANYLLRVYSRGLAELRVLWVLHAAVTERGVAGAAWLVFLPPPQRQGKERTKPRVAVVIVNRKFSY